MLGVCLTNSDRVALIDDADAWVRDFTWHDAGGYARARISPDRVESMHVLLMGALPGLMVDHVNGNGLDNRRANLRHVTSPENSAGARKTRRVTASPYKGVSRSPDGWVARARDGKGGRMYLGTFATEEAAARAYDEAVRAIRGEFGTYNFPREGERSALRVAA